jgi:hypothetical protein
MRNVVQPGLLYPNTRQLWKSSHGHSPQTAVQDKGFLQYWQLLFRVLRGFAMRYDQIKDK